MSLNDFILELKKLNIILSNTQLNELKVYCDFLLEYNSHTNLTAIKTPEEVYLKHFYDSLTLASSIDLNKANNFLPQPFWNFSDIDVKIEPCEDENNNIFEYQVGFL